MKPSKDKSFCLNIRYVSRVLLTFCTVLNRYSINDRKNSTQGKNNHKSFEKQFIRFIIVFKSTMKQFNIFCFIEESLNKTYV